MEVFVTVYEHKGPILPGLNREFMRHSGIAVKRQDGLFDIFHVIGTPGIGLTFENAEGWENPVTQTARLLSMEKVTEIPANRYQEMKPLLAGVKTQVSWKWNCQNWVKEGLDKMVEVGLVTAAERDTAVEKQEEAVHMPFTTETPNMQAR
jgi:hypothetical protein